MLIPARRQTSKDFDGCESRPSPQSGSTIFLALLLGICVGQATVWGVFYAFDGNFDTYDVESFHEDFWPSSHQKNLAQADCHGSPTCRPKINNAKKQIAKKLVANQQQMYTSTTMYERISMHEIRVKSSPRRGTRPHTLSEASAESPELNYKNWGDSCVI